MPHERTQRTVVVFADLETVRVVDGNDTVATHPRCWDRGQQVEHAGHIDGLTAAKRRAKEHRGLDRLARSARSSEAFLKLVAEQGGNVGSTTARLLQVLNAVGGAELEEALVEALERDTIHVGAVRQVIDRNRSARGLPPPITIAIAPGKHADLTVPPHSLATYDTLKEPKPS